MIAQQTDNYIRVCMKAWLLCESSMHAEANTVAPRKDLLKAFADCAASCVAVVSRLVSAVEGLERLAFTCLISCRSCQDECNRYADNEDILYCGDVCGHYAETMKTLTNSLVIAN